ncbi:MAG: hypothetical protein IH630_04365 [Thermoplasmata archaeon]|nr:hypothetical protein [Thermoplasmata archaeon]MCJ7562924.1 hypothetical protein [Thermoplasmata archaeon]
MASEEDIISSVLKGTKSMLQSETLIVDAVQELVKDEIKRHMRAKLDADPALRAELKKAIEEMLEAKLHEAYALLKIGKCGAKLGISMVPPEMRKEIGHELVSIFEKEMSKMLEQD